MAPTRMNETTNAYDNTICILDPEDTSDESNPYDHAEQQLAFQMHDDRIRALEDEDKQNPRWDQYHFHTDTAFEYESSISRSRVSDDENNPDTPKNESRSPFSSNQTSTESHA